MIDSKLIFDLGAHRGLDTKRYLAEGFKVVALEANPDCIEEMDKALASSGVDYFGRVLLVEKALHSVAGPMVRLYTSESPSGETHSLFPHRVKQCDDTFMLVDSCTLGELLAMHGVPWYMKIDIEGSDVVAIRQLHEWQDRSGYPYSQAKDCIPEGGEVPPYLSVELDWDHPEEAIEMFCLLGYMGYTGFELVQQHRQEGPYTTMPNELTYGCTLMEAIGIWADDGGQPGWWFDLHARHSSVHSISNLAPTQIHTMIMKGKPLG